MKDAKIEFLRPSFLEIPSFLIQIANLSSFIFKF
jgi:hypothetical protein